MIDKVRTTPRRYMPSRLSFECDVWSTPANPDEKADDPMDVDTEVTEKAEGHEKTADPPDVPANDAAWMVPIAVQRASSLEGTVSV